MHPSKLACSAVFILYIALSCAHQPGQEFQYLSMFMKPEDPAGYSTIQLKKLAEQYTSESVAGTFLKLPNRKLSMEPKTISNKISKYPNRHNQPTVVKRTLRTLKELTKGEEEEEEEEDEEEDDEEEEDNNNNNSNNNNQNDVRLPNQSVRVAIHENSHHTEQNNLAQHVANIAKRNGEDIKRMSFMLNKLITQYKVNSMLDIPCRAHAHWMPDFLIQLAKQNSHNRFKYICIDTNRAILNELEKKMPYGITTKFMFRRFWKDPLPRADLVFSWAGLDNMKQQNVVSYVEKLAASGKKHHLVLLGSHAGDLSKKGSVQKISRFTLGGNPINFREHPFLLAKPMRIVADLSTDGNDKQLYIYHPDEMIEV